MNYPEVMSERDTLKWALDGGSLSRFGDGELRLAAGAACTSQRAMAGLMDELQAVLSKRVEGLLPCIPNWRATPRKENWRTYAEGKYTRLFRLDRYGSAFITRPDSAPWIDEPEYWEAARQLWRGRDITLVVGDERSLRGDELKRDGVKSIRTVWGSRQHAYAQIDEIEEEVGVPSGPVILCLGACATVLAWRLARRRAWALDLGHIGMFMRHAGAYRHIETDLVSEKYLHRLKSMVGRWGEHGGDYAEEVERFADDLDSHSLIDYGCGQGLLGRALAARKRVFEYDPGIQGKHVRPKPNAVVACIDVLQHVEPDKLDNVLDHIFRLAGKGVFVALWGDPKWWALKLARPGWVVSTSRRDKAVVFKCITEEVAENAALAGKVD